MSVDLKKKFLNFSYSREDIKGSKEKLIEDISNQIQEAYKEDNTEAVTFTGVLLVVKKKTKVIPFLLNGFRDRLHHFESKFKNKKKEIEGKIPI